MRNRILETYMLVERCGSRVDAFFNVDYLTKFNEIDSTWLILSQVFRIKHVMSSG